MRNKTEHVGKLEIIRRLPSSTNGNGRYLLKVDGFTCRTAVDSNLFNYVYNYQGQKVKATIGTHYGHATLAAIDLIEN